MNVAFCTCVQLGKSCIEAILDNGGSFQLFLTLHDHKAKKKSGRIYLDDIAFETKTPLYKLNHINDPDVLEALTNHSIDWLFLIGWSQIASPEFLKVPKMGVIGAHPTLLPIGRGRAAIPWTILKGFERTGVTFFKMDEGVDTGDILGQIEIDVDVCESSTSLYEKINKCHVDLIKLIWPKLLGNTLFGTKQDETLATYWEGRTPADGELFYSMTLYEVDRLVRATTYPYPGAFKMIDNESKILIWRGSLLPQENSVPIQFIDGLFYAIEYEILKVE